MKKVLSVFISITIAVSAYFAVPALVVSAENTAEAVPPSFQISTLRTPLTPVGRAVKPNIARQSTGEFPQSYDPRDANFVTSTKDQGQYATCWAFAPLGAFESFQRVNNGRIFDFSERHLALYQSNFNPTLNHFNAKNSWTNGGTVEMAASYLTNFNGPMLESEFPYSGEPSWGSEYENTVGQMNVTDFNFVSGEGKIKDYILKYGGVAACMWAGGGTSVSMGNFTNFYEESTGGFYYDGGAVANHLVEIIGWDDSFPVSSFKSGRQPANPGAWLVRNSWGDLYNFIWLSYEDAGLWWTDNDTNPSIVTLGFGAVTKARYSVGNEFVKSRYGYASGFLKRTGIMPMVSVFEMEQGSAVTDVSVEFFADIGDFEGRVYVIQTPGNLDKYDYMSVFDNAAPLGKADIKSGVSTITLNKPYAIDTDGSYAFMVVIREKSGTNFVMNIPVEFQNGSTKRISYVGEPTYGLQDLYGAENRQAAVPVKVIYRAADYVPTNSGLVGEAELSGGSVSQEIAYNGNSVVSVKLDGGALLYEGTDYEITDASVVFNPPFVAAHNVRFSAVITFSEGIKRTVQYTTAPRVKYDVNNDGFVNAADALCLALFILDDFGYDGDMNEDGATNIEDALYLLKIAVGLVTID
jgi:Cysteine protease